MKHSEMDTTKEGIQERVIKVIMQVTSEDKSKISADSNLHELGIDSLDMAEIVMYLEREFDIDVKGSDATHLFTISDIVNYLEIRLTI